jgi:energy-coupling factor transporter ATP-binding protein EcfA2
VPRGYGLGDLSEILDERVYEQTAQLLTAERDNLTKFVPTEAYRNSVAALEQHGFVLLLGRAASGKSTIAATVSLAAPDAWNCTPINIERLEHFKDHWNPNSPGQLFWIDDIFGATQYLSSQAHEWNSLTPFIKAAVKGGCKIIATSRDYVYRHARADLKRGAFPLLTESQVVVDVESLSRGEREQILYNHLKLGNQATEFKKKIKPFLQELAGIPGFQPEVARRLGTHEFTKRLRLGPDELIAFVERPHEFLKDVIENLSSDDRAALATIFVNGGEIGSPVEVIVYRVDGSKL